MRAFFYKDIRCIEKIAVDVGGIDGLGIGEVDFFARGISRESRTEARRVSAESRTGARGISRVSRTGARGISRVSR